MNLVGVLLGDTDATGMFVGIEVRVVEAVDVAVDVEAEAEGFPDLRSSPPGMTQHLFLKN